MRRTTSVSATALIVAALVGAAPTTAHAAGETCRGEAATIVGTTPTLQGTPGRDVIVTGSSTDVLTGGGDDLVCVTGDGANANVVALDAGPGDDLVDSTAMPRSFYLTAVLGEGSDTFVGGAGSDSVVAGTAAGPYGEVFPEGERDLIDTGSGSDDVTSGGPGLPNDDDVRTGDGADYVTWSGTMGPTGVLDLGAGRDRLSPRASGQRFSLDLAAQTMSQDGVRTASFTSAEDLSVTVEPGLGTLEVRGSDGDDRVDVDGPTTLDVDLGAGVDLLGLEGARAGSHIDLGTGKDRLSVVSRDGSVDLDLARGTLAVDGAGAGTVTGVEDVWVSAEETRLGGDDRANVLTGVGCRVVVDGRGGKDRIDHSNFDADVEEGYDCDTTRVVLRGGSGDDRVDGSVRADRIFGGTGDDRIDTHSAASGTNRAWGGPGNDRIQGGGDKDALVGGAGRDVLRGSRGNDVLLGGRGRDKAVGGPGRDRCRAEAERSCER